MGVPVLSVAVTGTGAGVGADAVLESVGMDGRLLTDTGAVLESVGMDGRLLIRGTPGANDN